ncbi:Protein MS5 [Arabidopsis suecica]|uniref:Protein MS5 n=1 Tax=Arabidopsis suecica TaxID=45249 RepID=A0A8T2B989_ARASU|nr:Protein MS5 [Arabidopsis suecica]
MTSLLEDDRKDFFRGQMNYWRQIAESDGFDINDVPVPRGTRAGLWSVNCQHPRFRLRACLPKIYALLGLHRYNMLKGTNFQHLDLLKYNKSMNCVRSFYITSVAVDLSSDLQKTFQIRIDEKSYGDLDLTVSIARIKDEEKVTTKKRFIHHFHGEADADEYFYQGPLPDWPSVDDFNDQKRFYLVTESDFQSNDWIRLYLNLAVCGRRKMTSENDLSKLQILKVAIGTKEEDVQPPSRRLKAKSAYVYITFKGLDKAPIGDEIGEHVERKAIVRRVIDEYYFTLLGGFSIGEKVLNTDQPVSGEDQALDNEQSSEKRPRLD